MIQEHAAKTSSGQLQVQLPIDVATYIMNEKRDSLESIKKHSQLDVLLIPNPHVSTPHYDFKILTNPKNNQAASYQLVQIPKPDATTKRSTKPQGKDGINQFLSTPGNNNYGYSKRPEGVIKRLWGMMFGSEEEKHPVKRPLNLRTENLNPIKLPRKNPMMAHVVAIVVVRRVKPAAQKHLPNCAQ